MCSPMRLRMMLRGSPVGSAVGGCAVGRGEGSSLYGDSMCRTGSCFGFWSIKARTSFLVTRPRRPVPVTRDRSTLCSSAMRRTTGETGGLCSACPFSVCALCTAHCALSSTCASPGTAAVSMLASTVPTSTVLPTSTAIDTTRPDAGEGTSVSTLSVEISTIGSSFSTQSPTRFFHSTTVPSATETPIWGIVTSTSSETSVCEELTAGLLDVAGLGQDRALERRRERDRRVGRRDAHDRAVEVLEAALADQGGHLGADPARARGLVQHHDLARLADRREDRLLVERAQRAQVDHLDRGASQISRRLQSERHHLPVRDHAQVRALARHSGGPDRRLVA